MKNRKQMKFAGYTLLELIIVLFILTTMSSIIVGIFVVSVRTTTRISTINSLRQNGNYIMNQIIKKLQYAESLESVYDGTNITNFCPDTIPTTSYFEIIISTSSTAVDSFSCENINGTDTISLNSNSLLDTNNFNVSDCYFKCYRENNSLPYTVIVNFTIEKKVNTVSDNPYSVPFKSSVVLRNTGL